MKGRQARIARKTKETEITLRLNVDGKGRASIRTGIAFFDHMLTLFARHAVVDLELKCKGDLEVDGHHTVEDCGLALGQAFTKALDDKKGIRRYGFAFDPPEGGRNLSAEVYVPMDECLARCVIDFGGRPFFVWRGLDGLAFKPIKGDMAMEFRFGLAKELFKAFARAVDAACARDARIAGRLPTTKGTL